MFTKKVIFQAPQWHVLVHQESLIPISAIPDQIDEVGMMQETQHKNLHNELLISLKAFKIKLFDSNNLLMDGIDQHKK